MKLNPMTNHMTYENLLDTVDSFEAYLNEIKRLQEEKAAQEKQEAQRQRELAEQRKKERAIADDKAAYERAKRTNTQAAYEKYLKNFTNAVYRTEANAKVDHFLKLEQEEQAEQQRQEVQLQREQAIANAHQAFEAARHTDTKIAYETYLKNYPDGSTRDKYDAIYRINYFTKIEAERKAVREEERQFTQKIRWIKLWAMASGISIGTSLISDPYDKYALIQLIFLPSLSALFGGILGMAIRTILNMESDKKNDIIGMFIFNIVLWSVIVGFTAKSWIEFIAITPIFIIFTSTIMPMIILGITAIICRKFFYEIKNLYYSVVPLIHFVVIWVIFWSIIGWIIAINFIPKYHDLFEIYLTVWAITGFGLGLLIMKKFTRQL